ncbi:hypothetical protein G7Y89_g15207 [Cudoniella acicularis]|uniref:Uncharacterized protein n=1 Tax=Cudoniella acicularis TaxID=354080 RepID=A0A8H4VQ30_9HELO|nr:hypothetical protein G7Y89_g15207 [Cudoniella acicularis]
MENSNWHQPYTTSSSHLIFSILFVAKSQDSICQLSPREEHGAGKLNNDCGIVALSAFTSSASEHFSFPSHCTSAIAQLTTRDLSLFTFPQLENLTFDGEALNKFPSCWRSSQSKPMRTSTVTLKMSAQGYQTSKVQKHKTVAIHAVVELGPAGWVPVMSLDFCGPVEVGTNFFCQASLYTREALSEYLKSFIRQNPREYCFYDIIPSSQRQLPLNWNTNSAGEDTYNRCQETRSAAATQSLQEDTNSRCESRKRWLQRFASLAVFYEGALNNKGELHDHWKIKLLSDALLTAGDIQRSKEELLKIINDATERVLEETIKITAIITMKVNPLILGDVSNLAYRHFLTTTEWDCEQTVEFTTPEERQEFFRKRVEDELWILANWAHKCLPYLLDLPWLFHTNGSSDQCDLRNYVIEDLSNHFSRLADACFVGITTPKSKPPKNLLSLVKSSMIIKQSDFWKSKNISDWKSESVYVTVDHWPIYKTAPATPSDIWGGDRVAAIDSDSSSSNGPDNGALGTGSSPTNGKGNGPVGFSSPSTNGPGITVGDTGYPLESGVKNLEDTFSKARINWSDNVTDENPSSDPQINEGDWQTVPRDPSAASKDTGDEWKMVEKNPGAELQSNEEGWHMVPNGEKWQKVPHDCWAPSEEPRDTPQIENSRWTTVTNPKKKNRKPKHFSSKGGSGSWKNKW